MRRERPLVNCIEAQGVSERSEEEVVTSHFISEFKRYFGKSPKVYTQRLRDVYAAAIRDASSV